MPRTYEHLNQYDRKIIAQMLREISTWLEVGRRLYRSAPSIWREYHRNREADGHYAAACAHQKSMDRRKIVRRCTIVVAEMKAWIKSRLKKYWSSEQINGRGFLEGREALQ